MTRSTGPHLGAILYLVGMVVLSAYFVFAAVQGDYGLFRRAEIAAEARELEVELALLDREVARMENLTRRLSDEYLDLDLLDERARNVLGYIRANEVVIR